VISFKATTHWGFWWQAASASGEGALLVNLATSHGLKNLQRVQDEALEGLVNARSPDSVVLVVPLWSLPRSPEDRLTPRITRLFGRLLEDLALLPFWEGQARPFPKLE
jgi:hypothetical protein